MLQAIVLDQPIPTNDPTPAEERRNRKAQGAAWRMARKNAKFLALPPAEKRLAIAKDVLKWLDEGILKASYYYVNHSMLSGSLDLQLANGRTDHLNGYASPANKCEVCALGALLVTGVERGLNHGSMYNAHGDGLWYSLRDMHATLGGVFEEKQLCLIEMAFEGDRTPIETCQKFVQLDGRTWGEGVQARYGYSFDTEARLHEVRRVDGFRGQVRASSGYGYGATRNDYLRAIMQNIIDNGGEFKP